MTVAEELVAALRKCLKGIEPHDVLFREGICALHRYDQSRSTEEGEAMTDDANIRWLRGAATVQARHGMKLASHDAARFLEIADTLTAQAERVEELEGLLRSVLSEYVGHYQVEDTMPRELLTELRAALGEQAK